MLDEDADAWASYDPPVGTAVSLEIVSDVANDRLTNAPGKIVFRRTGSSSANSLVVPFPPPPYDAISYTYLRAVK